MKRLFLASEAKSSIKEIDDFVGGLKGKKIVYIGTVANGENAFGEWKTQGVTLNLLHSMKLNVNPIQLEDYKSESVLEDLRKNDIIWFAGGVPAYLMYWVIRCGLDRTLPDLLEKSIYVGSSAGSMICAKTLRMAALYPGEMDRNGNYLPGFGFINFEIFPHYEDDKLPMLKKVWKNEYGDLYLLKNGEAITVVGDKIEVLGEKRILSNGQVIKS